MNDTLEALGARIERVALDPRDIPAHTFFRLARPIVAMSGWRATIRSQALEALVEALGRARVSPDDLAKPDVPSALRAAIDELADNVDATERAAIVRGRAPTAHASWLRRAWELLVLAERVVERVAERVIERLGGDRADAVELRALVRTDRTALLVPLTLASSSASPASIDEALASAIPTRDAPPMTGLDARLVELELASIDRLLEAARAEATRLDRRRALFLAARQQLLELTAALPVDPIGASARGAAIAREISRIDRLQHAGVALDVGLLHQARLALMRGEPGRAFAAFAAIDGVALSRGDGPTARLATRAMAQLSPESDLEGRAANEASLQRSASEILGAEIVDDVGVTIANALAGARYRATLAKSSADRAAAARALDHFRHGAELEVMRASVAVDGCFEVGGALVPLRVVDEERALVQVRPPTETLELVPAREVDDLVDAIVGDPRTVLLDLAAGRLLTRRYLREERRQTSRVIQRSEVRVYVLDGSRSMVGPRARVRDGLMIAELATMIARLSSPASPRCTLFYRYFDARLGPVTRVDSVTAARAAISDVVGTLRDGETDIQRALLASLEQVAVARSLDPDLSRAQIVLVTDGVAAVDEAEVARARAAIEGLPIGVSVIALGEENQALRALVAHQRARGERAFYHFLDDARLAAIVDGSFDDGGAIHLQKSAERDAADLGRALEATIGPIVEELAEIERTRDVAALARLDDDTRARRVGDDDERDPRAREADRAHAEARSRDRLAVLARYDRWFPQVADTAPADGPARPAASAPEREEVDAVIAVLASVAEVVALIGSGPLGRRADAIELVERLLPDAHVTPARYRAVVALWSQAIAPALRAVHLAVGRAT